MNHELKKLVEEARAQGVGGDAENRLAARLRADLLIWLKYYRCDPALAEDLAQQKAMVLLKYLVEQEVNSPESFVRSTARNALVDESRRVKRMGIRLSIEQSRDGDGAKSGFGQLALEAIAARQWEERQQRESDGRREHLATALTKLKKDDYDLLEAVYVRGVDIETLAEEELKREPLVSRGKRTGESRTPKQARNAIDQHLTRARERLREIIEQEEAES